MNYVLNTNWGEREISLSYDSSNGLSHEVMGNLKSMTGPQKHMKVTTLKSSPVVE